MGDLISRISIHPPRAGRDACPIESKKPENVKELEEYVEWLSRGDDKA